MLFFMWTQGWRPGGTGGTVPSKFEVGGTAHALVPPIFREVVLSDVCERMNRVKNGLIKEFFFEIVSYRTGMHIAQPAARGPDPAPEGVVSGPRSRLKKHKKLVLNDGDFMNEFKLH